MPLVVSEDAIRGEHGVEASAFEARDYRGRGGVRRWIGKHHVLSRLVKLAPIKELIHQPPDGPVTGVITFRSSGSPAAEEQFNNVLLIV